MGGSPELLRGAGMRSHIWLLISGIGRSAWSFRLVHDVVIVGRNSNCDVVLFDDKVSRYHARIERGQNGKWHVLDRGSRNGTYLNGARIKQAEIQVGDTLQIGRTTLIVAEGTEKAPDEEFDVERETPSTDYKIIASANDQLEVLALLGAGLSRDEIGSKLKISRNTAKKHIDHIYAYYGVHTQPKLMARLHRDHDGKQSQ